MESRLLDLKTAADEAQMMSISARKLAKEREENKNVPFNDVVPTVEDYKSVVEKQNLVVSILKKPAAK